MKKQFDRKFGQDFLAQVPDLPGAYRAYLSSGELFYVGKATSLRRRLSQYRSATQQRKHARMRKIVQSANRWEWQVADSVEQAELLELRWIQELDPKFNLTGAFSEIYPFFGVRAQAGKTWLMFSHRLEAFGPGYQVYGAWRSRTRALEAFEAIDALISLIAVALPRRECFSLNAGLSGKLEKAGKIVGYRNLSESWLKQLDLFLLGKSRAALEDLAFELLESRYAREHPAWVESRLKALRAFYREEASALSVARAKLQLAEWPIPQKKRDEITIQLRHQEAGSRSR
jgi:excinuclease UvrABC nuclease subunit